MPSVQFLPLLIAHRVSARERARREIAQTGGEVERRRTQPGPLPLVAASRRRDRALRIAFGSVREPELREQTDAPRLEVLVSRQQLHLASSRHARERRRLFALLLGAREILRDVGSDERNGGIVRHGSVRYRIRMKLTDERTAGAYLVRSYKPGELRVGEEVLTSSCVVRVDRLMRDWRPRSVDEMTLADLEIVLALEPEIVVFGLGERQRFLPPELMSAMLSRGIGCEAMTTDAACRTYNVLVSEDRPVVAALIV